LGEYPVTQQQEFKMLPRLKPAQVIVDGQKMRSARARHALTQESLAHKARVNVRTIQRAESGAPLRHETLAEIAAVLGMPPSGLIRPAPAKEAEVLAAEAASDNAESNVLKRVEDGETVIRSLEAAIMSELSCSANPTPDLMPVLRAVIAHMESLMRSPWDEEARAPLSFSSVIDRLEAVAALNGHLADLEREGLALYLGSLTVFVRAPQWSEEGLVVNLRHQPQYHSAVRVHIGEYAAERVRLPLYNRWPLDLCDDYSDIPF